MIETLLTLILLITIGVAIHAIFFNKEPSDIPIAVEEEEDFHASPKV
jgi:hypothetical protein